MKKSSERVRATDEFTHHGESDLDFLFDNTCLSLFSDQLFSFPMAGGRALL